jgi:uncharacterized protein DUF1206
MSRGTQDAVVRLGQAVYVMRAMVIAGIGIAALDAAITYDAAKAKGVDGVLRFFAQSLFGPWLLILVAPGLIAFGVLSFVGAKWRRTLGGVPVWVKVYSSPERGWVSRLRPSWPALHG